jgi:hypothetical protein
MISKFFWGTNFVILSMKKLGKFLDKCVFPSVNSSNFFLFFGKKKSPYCFYQEIGKKKKKKKNPAHDLFFIYIYSSYFYVFFLVIFKCTHQVAIVYNKMEENGAHA